MLLSDPRALSNRWIDLLPAAPRRRVLSAAEGVSLEYRRTLVAIGGVIEHVYFPTSASIALLMPSDRGRFEVARVGREGFFGLPSALGIDRSENEAVVQGAGEALRMSVRHFRRMVREDLSIRAHVDRYAYVRMQQAARNAVCNRFHTVEQRLARWLLVSGDRVQSTVFDVTQAFLAEMLGVRRVGVTTAAQALQERRLIKYSRGTVAIRSRDGLRKAACGCYVADLATYRSVFE